MNLHSDTNFFVGLSEDVSEGGLFIATYELRPVGAELHIRFMLPDERSIEADATVVWIRETPADADAVPGMGVRFERLADANRDAITAFTELHSPLFYDI